MLPLKHAGITFLRTQIPRRPFYAWFFQLLRYWQSIEHPIADVGKRAIKLVKWPSLGVIS